MKHKILALTAFLTICTAAPVAAETIVDFGVSNYDGPGITIITSPRRHRNYYPHYRRGRIYRSRYRNYYPRYRHGWFNHPRYYDRFDHPRYGRDRFYYPRRSQFQIKIGF